MNTIKQYMMLLLIILGTVITGVTAIIQFIQNEQKEKASDERERNLNAKVDTLSNRNSQLILQANELSRDNSKLSQQLADVSVLLSQKVIGATEPVIQAFRASSTSFYFRVDNKSDLPIHHLGIRLDNFDEINKCNRLNENAETIQISYECYTKHSIDIVTPLKIAPNSKQELQGDFIIKGEYLHYAIQLRTLQKVYIRYYVFKVANEGLFEQAYKEYNVVDGKMVFSHKVDPMHLPNGYWKDHFLSEKNIQTIERKR